jgi:5'-nucleotidase
MKRMFLIMAIAVSMMACRQERLTILHTNDTHSCIEPERDGGAGVLNRALLLEHLRDSIGADNVLLFDCGDFSQGSLYYNAFKGAAEIELMNAMGYDACTIGNHEFDFGMDNMARIFSMAEFPVVCTNYDFAGTVCEGIVKPWAVIERAGMRIGVFGLSPDPAGLVLKENYEGMRYESPVEAARKAVAALEGEGCDVIVCLSHLGWKIGNEYNDERLAAETSGIDVILGGHSHDLFEEPLVYKNSKGEDVIVQQVGKNGRRLGYVTLVSE